MNTREPRFHDDGLSRPFGGGTPRDIVAEELAKFDGWGEIRPTHWMTAGRVVKALKAAKKLAPARWAGRQ